MLICSNCSLSSLCHLSRLLFLVATDLCVEEDDWVFGGDKEFVKSESEDEEIHTKNYYVCVSFFAKSLHNLFFFDSRKYTW